MHSIDASTLKRWLDSGEALLIDVREPAEYAAEHIKGATLVPLASVTAGSLPTVPGCKIVTQCRKGGRGGNACQKLMNENPALELYNLAGGIEAWIQTGFPVEQGLRRVLPLDRQVQLAIGVLLLTFSALAYASSPAFLLATAAIGLGLSIAGLTGFCGLARILARMPWNRV